MLLSFYLTILSTIVAVAVALPKPIQDIEGTTTFTPQRPHTVSRRAEDQSPVAPKIPPPDPESQHISNRGTRRLPTGPRRPPSSQPLASSSPPTPIQPPASSSPPAPIQPPKSPRSRSPSQPPESPSPGSPSQSPPLSQNYSPIQAPTEAPSGPDPQQQRPARRQWGAEGSTLPDTKANLEADRDKFLREIELSRQSRLQATNIYNTARSGLNPTSKDFQRLEAGYTRAMAKFVQADALLRDQIRDIESQLSRAS